MRCHICDAPLGEDEVRFNRDHNEFDPCGVCLEAIRDVFNEGDDDNEVVLGSAVELDADIEEVTTYDG